MSNHTIISAWQSGNSVYVETKDNNNCKTTWQHCGELISFSENMVSIKSGTSIKTYDANNHQTSSHSC